MFYHKDGWCTIIETDTVQIIEAYNVLIRNTIRVIIILTDDVLIIETYTNDSDV